MSLFHSIQKGFSNTQNSSSYTHITYENMQIERHIKVYAFNGMITVPICVFNQFKQQLETTSPDVVLNKIYDLNLWSNSFQGSRQLPKQSTLYKEILKEDLYREEENILVKVDETYGDKRKWYSGLGYLEKVTKMSDREIIQPLMFSAFVCQICIENNVPKLYILFPTIYFNLNCRKEPEVKSIVSKLYDAVCYSNLKIPLTDEFSKYKGAISLVMKSMGCLQVIDNVLTLNANQGLDTTEIQGFEEWICN